MRFQTSIFIVLGVAYSVIAVKASLPEQHNVWPLNPNLNSFSLLPRGLSTGTCNSQTPCENAACCGTNDLCGYSPSECGKGNCTSNCDAKAECGQYAAGGNQKCPLNVCCSEFGFVFAPGSSNGNIKRSPFTDTAWVFTSFCGSTDDFCKKGCQQGFGGCGPPNRPSCGGGGSVSKRTIGYYESWSNTRKCQNVAPEDLNLNGFTHINFAFAFFDPSSFEIAPMDGKSASLYNRFTALKNVNRGLQTWISVGGWSFTDPGPTRTAFSDMSGSAGNRQKFINELMKFMDTYAFDGVDLDWEYPQADDRGGASGDRENYVALAKELRAAFGSKYGISMTLPTSYWYLQHFDLPGIQASVDWFNLMAYDLHGIWDADSKFVGPYVAPHSNITEIDVGLDLLWRAGVTPDKVVMGQGWASHEPLLDGIYGRSFTLKDPSCNSPNGVCQFNGGANAGPCSGASGILDNQEIQDVIAKNSLSPQWDKKAAVKWITWDSNQWVSYDDDDTFHQKRDFANSRCLGGLMVWAMDQVDQKAGNSLARAPGVTTSQQQDAQQMSANLQAGVTCYTTDCGSTCKKGTNPVAQINGQPGQLSTNSRCANNKYHTLCCDDGTFMGTCRWRGYRGVGLSCISGCADGETEVVTDTNHHDKNGDQSCTGGLQSYCCKGFKPIPSKGGLKSKAEDAAKAAAEAAAENAVLDVAAKAFCRVAVPALLAPLELLEDLIPIVGKSRISNASPSCKLIWLVGEILDLAEIAATPALIDVCVKGVEKEGKAEFKVFGKKHSLNFNKPTEKPSATRPPKSSHTPAKTSQNSCEIPKKAKRAGDGDCNDRRRKKPMRATTSIEDHADPPTDIFCDYALYGQACLHYNSVIHHNPGYGIITCPYSSQGADRRPIVAVYNQERKEGWIAKIPAFNGGKGCERDEWPPAHLHEANNGYLKLEGSGGRPSNPRQQYVRLINGDENGNAGQLWKNCPKVAQRNDIDAETSTEHGAGRIDTVWTKVKAVYTRKAFSMRFRNLVNPDGDDGLQLNQCQPEQLNANGNRFDHRGFALLNEDSWFDRNPNAKQYTAAYGQAPNFKRRDLDWLDPDQISVVDANSTRKATDKELRHDFGLIRCTDKECSQELADLNIKSALRFASPQSTPIDVPATATATTPSDVMAATATAAGLIAQNAPSLPGHEVSSAEFPRRTWVP